MRRSLALPLALAALPSMMAAGDARPREARAEVRLFAFRPDSLVVAPGTRVVWTNHDDIEHTVTADSPAVSTGEGLDGAMRGKGAAFAHTFTRAGTYVYACGRHPSMRGMVTVQP
jgi:plastocyanin